MDAPPAQQQSSSSSSSSLFTQVTLSSPTATVPRSAHYSPAEMATTATEAYAVRMALVEEEKQRQGSEMYGGTARSEQIGRRTERGNARKCAAD